MPINALAVAKAFAPTSSLAQDREDRAVREENEQIRGINALKRADTRRAYGNKETLNALARQGMPLDQMADVYQGETGDIDTALRIRDKHNANALSAETQKKTRVEAAIKGIEYLATTGRAVTPETYAPWKAKAEELGIAQPGELPEQYEPDVMRRLITGAEDAYSELQQIPGAPAGVLGQRSSKNEWKKVYEPREPKTPTLKEVYDESSPTKSRLVPAEQAAGKPGKPSRNVQAEKRQMAIQSIVAMGASPQQAEQIADGLLSGAIKFNQNAFQEGTGLGAFVDINGRPIQIGSAPVPAPAPALEQAEGPNWLAQLFGSTGRATPAPPPPMTKEDFDGPVMLKAGAKGTEANPYTPQTTADMQTIPAGAVYINPATGKPHRKR